MVRYDFQKNTKRYGSDLKINQDDYIETNTEPFDSEIDSNMSVEIELEMAETVYDMRREFKRANKRLRRFYTDKEPRRLKVVKFSKSGHYTKRRAIAQ